MGDRAIGLTSLAWVIGLSIACAPRGSHLGPDGCWAQVMNQAHEYGVHEGQLREWEQGVGKMAITTAAGIEQGATDRGFRGFTWTPWASS
jgi:hypothetical protein